MNIEKIVFQHASKLLEKASSVLSKDECFDLINSAVSEAANEVNDNFVLDNVSNRRKLLIAYTLWLDKDYKQGRTDERLVDSFIKERN